MTVWRCVVSGVSGRVCGVGCEWSGVWCRVLVCHDPLGNGRKPQRTAANDGELSDASVGVVRGEGCANLGARLPPYPLTYVIPWITLDVVVPNYHVSWVGVRLHMYPLSAFLVVFV